MAPSPANTRQITRAAMTARARTRRMDAPKAFSTLAVNREDTPASRQKACTVSRASRLSPAKPTASANRSCACIDSLRTRRP